MIRLILYYPGMSLAEISQPAAHIDIFPTLCELLSLERPSSLKGVSLLPAIRGKKLGARQIYFESLEPYYNLGWAPLAGFIEGDVKFIESPLHEIYDLTEDFQESQRLNPNLMSSLRSLGYISPRRGGACLHEPAQVQGKVFSRPLGKREG